MGQSFRYSARALGFVCVTLVSLGAAEGLADPAQGAGARTPSVSAGAPPGEIPVIAPAALAWTDRPGAFEQDLKRRNANPLYPMARQIVTEEDLQQAVIRDAADTWDLLEEFIDLELGRKRMARLESREEIDAALAKIEAAIRRGMGVGGPAVRMAQALRRMRVAVIKSWRESNAEDTEVMERLAGIEKSGELTRPVAVNSFAAQLLRKKGPIRESERVSAILSQDPDDIEVAIRAISPRQKKEVQQDGLALLRGLEQMGVDVDEFEPRIAALFAGEGSRRSR